MLQPAAPAGGILEQSWESQLLELEARLATSLAKWKLVSHCCRLFPAYLERQHRVVAHHQHAKARYLQVVGHHPVRNNHMPENTPELMQHLEPVLEAQVCRIMVMLKGYGFTRPRCKSPLPAGSASLFQRA